jgi:hypothetical protein
LRRPIHGSTRANPASSNNAAAVLDPLTRHYQMVCR